MFAIKYTKTTRERGFDNLSWRFFFLNVFKSVNKVAYLITDFTFNLLQTQST